MCLLAKMSWIKEYGNHAEIWRLSTFVTWPQVAKVSPLVLAKCGFFYIGEGDKVKCFKCNSTHENWQDGENPEVRHKQESPNCSVAQGDTDGNVPLKVPDEIIQEHSKPITSDIDSKHTHCAENFKNNSLPSEGEVSDCGINSVYQSALERAIRHGLFSQGLSPLDRNNPDFDSLRRESFRLSTYHDWPSRAHARPRDLVKKGFFFTGIDDRVQCAFCRGFLRNWVPGDTPAEEHRKHFPECPLLRGLDVGNVVDETEEKSFSNNDTHFTRTDAGPQSDLALQETPAFDSGPLAFNSPRPKHPEYAVEARRIHSFRGGYVPRGQTIEVLAKAGFYYVGPHDNVRCFHCDGGLKNWQADDDPWVEHGRWFPRCAYLATQRDQMFIEASQVPRNLTLTRNLPPNSIGRLLNTEPQFHDPLKTRIRQLYPDLVAEVEPRGYILDFLFQKEVLSMDCRTKLINVATRQDRCRGLLEQLLSGSHPQGCLMLREALKQNYPWIVQKIDQQPASNNSATQGTPTASRHTVEPREVKARMDSPKVRAIIDMGYSRDIIRQAIERRLVSTGDDFPNAETLLEALFQMEEPNNTAERKEVMSSVRVHSTFNTTTGVATTSTSNPAPPVTHFVTESSSTPSVEAPRYLAGAVGPTTSPSEATPKSKKSKKKKKKKSQQRAMQDNSATDRIATEASTPDQKDEEERSENEFPLDEESQRLLEENSQLKEARNCKVCMDNDVNTVFLPCGHLVCCNNCSPNLRNCPICRSLIRGTVRIFLS